MAQQPEFQDYYRTLGVARSATLAEIMKAFRKLARESHPDKHPGDSGAERRFKEINEANAVLSDPSKRAKYDQFGRDWEAYARAGATPGGAGPVPSGPAVSGGIDLVATTSRDGPAPARPAPTRPTPKSSIRTLKTRQNGRLSARVDSRLTTASSAPQLQDHH